MEHTFSTLAHNTLMAKVFKGIGDFDLSEYNVFINYNKQEHKLELTWGSFEFEIVKLDDGVCPSQWALDGRRNWRAMKRLVTAIREAQLNFDKHWMFEDESEGGLMGEVVELERLIREFPATILEFDNFLEPYPDLELARQLDANHPLFDRYEEAVNQMNVIRALPNFEADKQEAQAVKDAAAEEHRNELRARYIGDTAFRQEQDAIHRRYNIGIFSMTDEFEDLREMFANGEFDFA